jgi:hypothetical protein
VCASAQQGRWQVIGQCHRSSRPIGETAQDAPVEKRSPGAHSFTYAFIVGGLFLGGLLIGLVGGFGAGPVA